MVSSERRSCHDTRPTPTRKEQTGSPAWPVRSVSRPTPLSHRASGRWRSSAPTLHASTPYRQDYEDCKAEKQSSFRRHTCAQNHRNRYDKYRFHRSTRSPQAGNRCWLSKRKSSYRPASATKLSRPAASMP